VEQIGEGLGRLAVLAGPVDLRLRRIRRIQTLRGSLAIEGNTLSEDQISTILNGKPIVAPPREVQEIRNAIKAYDAYPGWDPTSEADLLEAHATMTLGLLDNPGHYRSGGVGVMGGSEVIHVAPPARRVPELMQQLLTWLRTTDEHPLITSSVFHYEFEFIHPFPDGNGRLGRLWQTLILTRWNPLLADIPVESMIHARQDEYYAAIGQSSKTGRSTVFIEFMLETILARVLASADVTPQVTPQHTPQVGDLIAVLNGEMSRRELLSALGLSDRKSMVFRYLRPALDAGLVEMTIPDKPNSRNQKYRLTPMGWHVRNSIT
jgi:Fic family protein